MVMIRNWLGPPWTAGRRTAHGRWADWRRLGALLACLGWTVAANSFAQESGTLVWHAVDHRVEARIQAWSLEQVLERLAAATGWQIYVEPDAKARITATFHNLEVGAALARLLGDLNYALLPQKDGPGKLFVFRTSVQEATQLVKPRKPAKSSSRLANELIVTLKPGAKTNIDQLARRWGAKVVGRADALNAYRLQFDSEAAANLARDALQANPEVSSVGANYRMNQPTETNPLALSSAPPLNLKPNQTPDPHRLVVGLIDTPVQAAGTQIKDFVLPAISVVGDVQPDPSTPTHGTSMAETILRGLSLADASTDGVSTRILPVDVYGNSENTTTFDVANGIIAAVKNGANLINLSLGSDSDSPFLHQVIQQAHDQGVVFVAAAGNVPTTDPTYPAAYPEVLAATAGDSRGNIAPYANRGSFVSVIAPGSDIFNYNGQPYLVTGTSAASAYVSGLAAGLAANSGNSLPNALAEIRQALGVKPPGKP